VRRGKLLSLTSRLLIESRPLIKKVISNKWSRLLKQYHREPAMENDQEFEKLLAHTIPEVNEVLSILLKSPKLALAYHELEKNQGNIPEALRIFQNGALMPYSSLFFFKRKDILTDIRILLPFWYSIPFIVAILAFFKGKKNKKDATEKKETDKNEKKAQKTDIHNGTQRELIKTARQLETELIPSNTTMEDYLSELEGHWNRLISDRTKKELTEDVNSLIRDHLRQLLRTNKRFQLDQESLSKTAFSIIQKNSTLSSLKDRDHLHPYIEAYLIKLMQNVKMLR
jgi:hypothetical protein